ncbi:MAG TPA: hypothetical protein VD867_04880 [Burkholderiales bacterium]|nr:hypothetical protein [Burkholderiales bacterium]
MRKLRRLPWRIPKSHHSQPAADAQPVASARDERDEARNEARAEAVREAYLESLNAQPVAFCAGRYVKPTRPARAPEIRRKTRHHAILPLLPVAG